MGWSLGYRVRRAVDRYPATDNIVRIAIDTATSIIARQRPRPVVLTDGANWSTRQRAKRLSRFIEGIFRAHGVWDMAPIIFRDCAIYGTGVWKVQRDDEGHVCIERCHIDDIIVDELQCRTAQVPLDLHHRHFVHVENLKEAFPEAAGAIEMAAQKGDRKWTSIRSIPSYMVPVVESWRPRLGKKPGKHSWVVEGKTLHVEEYNHDDYPFVFERWRPPTGGFYGRGIAEELINYQTRLNQTNRFIHRAQDFASAPRGFYQEGSIQKEAFSNQVGALIGVKRGYQYPAVISFEAVKQEIYNYRIELKESALRQIGVSQQAAYAQKTPGIDSGAGVREINDLDAARFSINSLRHESSFVDLSRKLIQVAKDIYEDDGEVESIWQAKSFVEKIPWSEVELEDDCFCLTVEASSLLTRTPAARKQEVTELAQAGALDKDQMLRLLDLPDLQKERSMVTAAAEAIDWKIEQVSNGKDAPASSFDNLELYAMRFTAAYHEAETQGAPREVLNRFRIHIEMAQAKKEAALQAMQAQAIAQQQLMQPPAPAPEAMPAAA